MDLTPQLFTDEVEFRESRRGYNRAEVDEFLDKVADSVAQLQEQVTAAEERAQRAEQQLATAGKQDRSVRPAAPDEDEVAEEARRTLLLAQRTADAAVREAKEEAIRRTTQAEEEATRLVRDADAEAGRRRDDAHRRLTGEIGELEAHREAVRADLDRLRAFVDGQRDRIGTSAAELRRYLDDPGGLTVEPAPPEATGPAPTFVEPAAEEVSVDPEPVAAEEHPEVVEEPAVVQDPVVLDAEVEDLPDATVPEPDVDPVDDRATEPDDDLGPSTEAVALPDNAAEGADAPGPASSGDEDAFLAELRKAMTDDDDSEPLGPAPEEELIPDRRALRPRARFGRRTR